MWDIHDCLNDDQIQYSVIRSEESRNQSNRRLIHRQWVVLDEYDGKMSLKGITHCPFCGTDLDKELRLARA